MCATVVLSMGAVCRKRFVPPNVCPRAHSSSIRLSWHNRRKRQTGLLQGFMIHMPTMRTQAVLSHLRFFREIDTDSVMPFGVRVDLHILRLDYVSGYPPPLSVCLLLPFRCKRIPRLDRPVEDNLLCSPPTQTRGSSCQNKRTKAHVSMSSIQDRLLPALLQAV